MSGTPVELPTPYEVALLRIAQSALANTVRHASATRAEITLSFMDASVTLDVVDDGKGFDPALLSPSSDDGGFGLPAMRARAESLGGAFTVESARSGRGRRRVPPPSRWSVDMTIRLLLADDHPVVRAGLRAVLDAEPDFAVVGEAATAERAVELAVELDAAGGVDVVLMDLQFGAGMHGSEATAAITARTGGPRVLVLTTYDTDADILAAVEAGPRAIC